MRNRILIFVIALCFSSCASSVVHNDNLGGVLTGTDLQSTPTPTPKEEQEQGVPFDEVATKLGIPLSDDYPAPKTDMFSGTPAEPRIVDKRAKLYGTVIREGAKRGPNFAGHYTIVTWGAGLGSFSMAVIDARTGSVYFPPFESVSRAGYFQIDDNEPPAFRLESKLYAFMGCPGNEYDGCADWDKDGFYVYRFDRGKFSLLKFIKRKEFEAASQK